MIMPFLWLLSSAQGFEAFIIVNNPCLIERLSSGDGKKLDQFGRGELFHLVMKYPHLLGQKRNKMGQSSSAEEMLGGLCSSNMNILCYFGHLSLYSEQATSRKKKKKKRSVMQMEIFLPQGHFPDTTGLMQGGGALL